MQGARAAMSDARVTFHELAARDADPGKEQQFEFQCPKRPGMRCGSLVIAGRTSLKRDGQNKNGGIAQWDWNGSRAAPTFTPSINCGSCWHGYIRNGRCVSTGGIDEP